MNNIVLKKAKGIINRLVNTNYYFGEYKGIDINNVNLTENEINGGFNLELMDIDSSENYQAVVEYAKKEHNEVIPVSCEVESELSILDEAERKEYMEAIGLNESGLNKVIKATYKLLNLSTFFTVGSDECRAWTFKNGMSAPECACVIHTDFQRGFICAEVYTYDAIHELGSEAMVKENGKLRREGKDYRPKDGDIMFFRFNV